MCCVPHCVVMLTGVETLNSEQSTLPCLAFCTQNTEGPASTLQHITPPHWPPSSSTSQVSRVPMVPMVQVTVMMVVMVVAGGGWQWARAGLSRQAVLDRDSHWWTMLGQYTNSRGQWRMCSAWAGRQRPGRPRQPQLCPRSSVISDVLCCAGASTERGSARAERDSVL